MFIDASVMIAILEKEDGFEALATQLDDARSKILITSVVAVWEAAVVVFKKNRLSMAEAELRVQDLLKTANIEILPISDRELSTALQAFERYGRHHYPVDNRNSALNLADCFHYATAKSRNAPILTKDAGFALTDLEAIGPLKNQ